MSAASFLGVLHIRIFTFSPSALTASVVMAFCVDILLTISVQNGVLMWMRLSSGFLSLFAMRSLSAFTSFMRYLMVFTIQ